MALISRLETGLEMDMAWIITVDIGTTAMRTALADILAQYPEAAMHVGGISLTSQGETLFLVDPAGIPQYPAITWLDRLAASGKGWEKGLYLLPDFEGKLTPEPNSGACGVLFGLTLDTTRADIARAFRDFRR